jgi:hypothetical protein
MLRSRESRGFLDTVRVEVIAPPIGKTAGRETESYLCAMHRGKRCPASAGQRLTEQTSDEHFARAGYGGVETGRAGWDQFIARRSAGLPSHPVHNGSTLNDQVPLGPGWYRREQAGRERPAGRERLEPRGVWLALRFGPSTRMGLKQDAGLENVRTSKVLRQKTTLATRSLIVSHPTDGRPARQACHESP